jgi:hypothetical protein
MLLSDVIRKACAGRRCSEFRKDRASAPSRDRGGPAAGRQ